MALVKYNDNSISAISSAGQLATGGLVPIKTLTASSSATLSFVDGSGGVVLDSTYPIYMFKFINIHPATNSVLFQFNLSTDSGSNYNVAKTTTAFAAQHKEDDSSTALSYDTGEDLANGTGFQSFLSNIGNLDDESASGEMFLYSPSSTTFVKHFTSRVNHHHSEDISLDCYIAGYGNTTSAINAVQFKMSSGNIDSGKIKLYGIKDS